MTDIFTQAGKKVGYIENRVYYTTRNYVKNQIFKKPEYESAVGLDEHIINKYDFVKNVDAVVMTIFEFEPQSFDIVISFREFLGRSRRINFENLNSSDKKRAGYNPQRILPMKHFIKIYGIDHLTDILYLIKLKEAQIKYENEKADSKGNKALEIASQEI